MSSWLALASEAIRNNEGVVLVTVCGVEGSAPREAGAKMLVTRDRFHGTIGGGNLEFNAIARAREILGSDCEIQFEDLPLGPALAQCCGGRVRIGYERLDSRDLEWLQRAGDLIAQSESIILERNLSERDGRRRVNGASATQGASAIEFLDERGRAIADQIPPLEQCAGFRERVEDDRPRIFVFGAGHVGTAIIRILEGMPAAVTWVDRRAECFPAMPAANVSMTETGDEVGAASIAPAGSYFLVLTHSHDVDYELVHAILKRGDAAYCGLIGSETKRARFARRLRRAGLDDSHLARLTCPIGVNGLKSKAPASIALSTVLEVFLAHEARTEGGANWK
ncbi:MAG: xanthine dehydrogenase accessory protein XdhC [Parvularculaceae bacterium]